MITNFFAKLTDAIKARAAASFSVFIPMYMHDVPVFSERHFRTYVQEGYRRNELIFACIEKVANTAAQCRLQVLTKDSDDPIEDHPLRQLLERPNPWMSEFDFWAMTLISMKLAGAAYWYKWRSRAGFVVQMWPMRPDLMAPVPGEDEPFKEWEYQREGGERLRIPAADVLAFRKSDPLDFFKTISPMEPLSRSADVDNAITSYLKKFFDRGAMPAGALKSKMKLSPQSITDLMNQWEKRYGGADNWHKPVILDSDAEYQRTGLSFDEMEFESLDARNEARICMALGVPPILVGARVGLARSTFSNYAEARKAWWEDDLIPVYKMLSDVIDLQLAGEFDENIDTEWDFSEVPALIESRDSMWTRATAALTAGYITVNMALRESGLEEIGPPGDVFLRTPAMQMIPVDETVEDQRERQAEEQAAALEQLQAGQEDGDKPAGLDNGEENEDKPPKPFPPKKEDIIEAVEAKVDDTEAVEDMIPPTPAQIDQWFALYEEVATNA
jgi:HK97 family phage portal protein